jgi:hypothetical protein
MESHPNFYDYGHFSDHSQAQNGSVYEVWSVEDFHYEAGLDVSHFQPVSVFESENGSAESSFTTDFTSSQLTSHNAFGYTENNHSDLTWVPQEATEAYNWLPTSDASAVCTNFRQEINNGDRIAKSLKAVVIVPSPNVRPLQLISPSITFQQLSNEDVEPPVYAPQNGFKPLLDGESGEGPLYNHSLYVLPFLI